MPLYDPNDPRRRFVPHPPFRPDMAPEFFERPPKGYNPSLDPRLNPFPLPPGWAKGRLRLPYQAYQADPGPVFRPPDSPYGSHDWWWGMGARSGINQIPGVRMGAHPGLNGEVYVGKKASPETGGWVYGLGQNWDPRWSKHPPHPV